MLMWLLHHLLIFRWQIFLSSFYTFNIIILAFFFLFYSFSAHPSSYIIALTLHSFFAFLLLHTLIVHSDRVPMHSRYQLIYFIKH